METSAGDADSSLLSACHENWISAMEFPARIVPGGTVERVGGATVVRTPMPGSVFNVVFALAPPTSLEDPREVVDRLFVSTKTPFRVVTKPGSIDWLRPMLDELGLSSREDVPGMVLDSLPEVVPDPPGELEIRPVTKVGELADYLRTGSIGFGDTPDSHDPLLPGLTAELRSRSPRAPYCGFVRGRPVATSLRIRTRRIAGIYFVSTLPEFRRRGIGEAMTWQAAIDGRIDGCSMSYLQASPMGRPVYERMGYRVVEWYQEWRAPKKSDPRS